MAKSNHNSFSIVELPLTVSGCSNTSVLLLTYLNDKLFLYVLKTLYYDGSWENKKFSDEIQCFDWIKSIH